MFTFADTHAQIPSLETLLRKNVPFSFFLSVFNHWLEAVFPYFPGSNQGRPEHLSPVAWVGKQTGRV